MWFGTSEPDDSKGALPYDTYIIEEMRCDSNKGFELIPPFEIVVSRNNLVIDLGTLTDEYEKEISIHTTATSMDGEKTILAGKEVTIVDTVKLDGLTKGTKSVSYTHLIMLASITKTISLPKLLVHGLQRQSLKLTATGQLITSQN